MMRACFAAEKRIPMNKSGLKNLRRNGRLPASIMGLNQESEMVHISLRDFNRWVRGGSSGLLEIKNGDSEATPVLLQGLQKDVVTREYIHADFLRVRTDEAVRAKVSLDFVGTPIGEKAGGTLQTQSTVIEVESLPQLLPATITVDISDLQVGESLLVGDIKLPAEVKMLSPEDDPLLTVIAPTLQQEETDEEPEEK